MQSKVEKLPKSTVKLTVTVDNAKIKENFEKVLDGAVEQTVIEGFRKGTAPREMVKSRVGLEKLYADLIDLLLKTYYPQALKENLITPIANPQVEIKEFDIEKDLEFTATIAVKPEVKIGDYKKAIKDSFEKRLSLAKRANEEKLKSGEKIEEPHVHIGTNEVIEALNTVSEVEISDILINEETDRMMARLVDQAQTLGLSLEQYLKAQNKTADQLRKDYNDIAEKNIKAEFILGNLVVTNKIEATDDEIKETMVTAGFTNEEVDKRMADTLEKFYVKSILQKNKLLSSLIAEAEGEHHHEHK